MISVMIDSGMNEASSQIAKFAVYPLRRCSLHGRAIICDWVDNWMSVLVLRVMLLFRNRFDCMKPKTLSNIIMLCRIDGETISVVVFGCVNA